MAPEYFNVQPIPRQLKNQVQIYFEEQLYALALTLLTNTLGSGVSSAHYFSAPRLLPPPSHLGFICSLIVSPRTTTRAETYEARQAASMAQGYLQNVLHLTGARHANFVEAFKFRSQGTSRRNRVARLVGTGGALAGSGDVGSFLGTMDYPEEMDEDVIGGHAAREQNLWSNGQDFWAVVGWAFNCSVLYPRRWECWREWLTFMIEVLKDDWEENSKLTEGLSYPQALNWMHQSMLSQYLSATGGRNSGFKMIRKALLADGKNGMAVIFPEVFPRETKDVANRKEQRQKAEMMDLENGRFGDYDSDESEENVLPDDITKLPLDSPFFDIPEADDPDLDNDEIQLYIESIPHRLQITSMLSNAILAFDNDYVRLWDFWENLIRDIRQQPFEIFQAFTEYTTSPLNHHQFLFFMNELFQQLLPLGHLKPERVNRELADKGSIDQEILERSYLPHAAVTITVQDNAQLQHVCEQTMIALAVGRELDYRGSLEKAAKKGLEAKLKKTSKARLSKRIKNRSELAARNFLGGAMDRMLLILANMNC